LEVFLDCSAWRGYRLAQFPAESWREEAETLHALADGPAVSLISRQCFGDFDLSFEWRLPVGGNSGLLYKVTEDREASWQSGPEMQLLDNGAHPDGRVPETSCGALYGLYAPQGNVLCPAGLFNIGRVSVRGFRVEHWLNGIRVLACDLSSHDFRLRVSRSKFCGLPRFACAAEGHIVLQHHGTAAAFRNIRLATMG
jgi:hypothetical protein